MAYVRFYPPKGTDDVLVAKADGSDEHIVGGRKLPARYASSWFGHSAGLGWSPDGRTIATLVSDNPGRVGSATPSWTLVGVPVASGAERAISSTRWSSSGRAVWLGDGSGLIIDTSDQTSSLASQLWYVAYPSGEARRITNDPNRYFGVSLTADSSALVTVQGEVASSIWVAPRGEASGARQITSGSGTGAGLDGIACMPNGGVVYTSNASGRSDIWSMGADGSSPVQLTLNGGNSSEPGISPDGQTVVFSSDRDGNRNIWRMNIDGSSPKQLTHGDSDTQPQITPDGKWLIYGSWSSGKLRLWKQRLDGGAPESVIERAATGAVVSP